MFISKIIISPAILRISPVYLIPILETALNEKCAADARQIQQAVKNKDSREKAWKPYLSDENFNTWFEQITKDINEKMKDSDA